mmetsp:Transcript_11506/g.31050  ORF Transcript_11506/g.31050 Transcript_11506/m.31050 type:complete len:220 (-) Transcript_11506:275-934(-)
MTLVPPCAGSCSSSHRFRRRRPRALRRRRGARRCRAKRRWTRRHAPSGRSRSASKPRPRASRQSKTLRTPRRDARKWSVCARRASKWMVPRGSRRRSTRSSPPASEGRATASPRLGPERPSMPARVAPLRRRSRKRRKVARNEGEPNSTDTVEFLRTLFIDLHCSLRLAGHVRCGKDEHRQKPAQAEACTASLRGISSWIKDVPTPPERPFLPYGHDLA